MTKGTTNMPTRAKHVLLAIGCDGNVYVDFNQTVAKIKRIQA